MGTGNRENCCGKTMKPVIIITILIMIFVVMGAYLLYEGIKVQSALERTAEMSRETEKIIEENKEQEIQHLENLRKQEQEEATPMSFIIPIIGDDSCKTKTNQALELLKNKANTVFEFVVIHVGVIECVDQGSGMKAFDTPPRYLAGKETVDAGTIWYAVTIAHDSYHSYLYSNYMKDNPQANYVPDDIWTGGNAEAESLAFQYDALVLIGASQSTLDYVKNTVESEYWEIPYEERWW